MRKRALLEAALFTSSKPIPLEKLCELLAEPEARVKELLGEIKVDLRVAASGLELFETGDAYQLRVKPRYAPRVKDLAKPELRRGARKALAMAVFKQPITQSEIVKTIGNRTYEYVRELEQKRLIKSVRWKRTKLLELTTQFFNYFGLKREDLGKLRAQVKGEQGK